MRDTAEVVTLAALAAGLLAYAVLALAVERWWISGLAAPAVAALLVLRHRRARFSAYVFLSVATMRGLVHGVWPVAAGAAGAILLLQAPPARRLWPRLPPRWARRAGRRDGAEPGAADRGPAAPAGRAQAHETRDAHRHRRPGALE